MATGSNDLVEHVVGDLMADSSAGSASDPWTPSPSVAAATWALFVGLGFVMVGNGLNGSLLGVRSEAEGFSLSLTGVIMAAYFAGFLLGTSYTEYALKRVGHIRVFSAMASMASTVVLVQALSANPVTWAATRFIFGACMAGVYVVVESWLNDLATNRTRGRILSVYMLVTMGGLGAGQLLLGFDDPSGVTLFVVASLLVSVSLVPIALSTTSSPPSAVPAALGVKALAARVPTGVFSSFLSGAAAGSLVGMSAVYASDIDLGASRLSMFLAAPMLGALVFQWPVGGISDRVSRRSVIFAVACGGTAASLLPLFVETGSYMAIVAMFLIGGMMFPLYSLVVAYTNDYLTAEEILAGSGTLVRINGAGAVVGPLLSAFLMAAFGARLFFLTLSGLFFAVAAFVFYRIISNDGLPQERQRSWVPMPARASAMAAHLIPRRRRDSRGVPVGPPMNDHDGGDL